MHRHLPVGDPLPKEREKAARGWQARASPHPAQFSEALQSRRSLRARLPSPSRSRPALS